MIPKTVPPICKDCAYYHYREGMFDEGRPPRHQCHRERDRPFLFDTDLVTGEEIFLSGGKVRSCETERRNGMFFWLPLQSLLCGPGGRFFRPKNPADENMPNAGED